MFNKVKRYCLICGNSWIGKKNDCYPPCPTCGKRGWDKGNNIPCEICGRIVFIPDIHHKDKNPRNNLYNNRMALCKKCHNAIHFLDKKKRIYLRKIKNNMEYKPYFLNKNNKRGY